MKQIFVIESFIPSDEKEIYTNVYKLIKFGNLDVKYGFILINNNGGIGTGTDDFGHKSDIDALLNLISVIGIINNETHITKIITTDKENELSLDRIMHEVNENIGCLKQRLNPNKY